MHFRQNLLFFSRRSNPRQPDRQKHVGRLLNVNASTQRFKYVGIGFCAVTMSGYASCNGPTSGSVAMHADSSIRDAEACFDYCRQCHNCNFVSISAAHDDCSWFKACATGSLNVATEPAFEGDTYTTFARLPIPRRRT